MKNIIAIVIFLFTLSAGAQGHQAYDDGEWFRFRIHYGMFNASFATLKVEETNLNNQPVFHVVGKGRSTGLLHLFFKVDDNYETYIHKTTGSPLRFIRKIDEGGYTKDIQIDFDHSTNTAVVFNKERNEKKVFTVQDNVHDMLSSFYFLRNNLDVENLEKGEMMSLNMFFDNENHEFKLKFLGREVVKTKLGNIAALKFKPYVLAGRVFKEKESLTMWVSDDKNRMPLKIKADLAVGALEADIDAFKGLKHPLNIIMK
ncbi:DUF3108 domain-containing protein [Salinimicrobium soli]|uniref:DUF3108 domain-containing protein n=1 Tax=Salinimicrobium soli TaxID=1254399 RepID=UPI003AAF7A9B